MTAFPPTFVNNAVGPNGEQLNASTLNSAFQNAKTYTDNGVATAEAFATSQSQTSINQAIALAIALG